MWNVPNSRVLLINDDAFELATLASAMRLHGVNVVGEANNYLLAENLFKTLKPDVVVIDVQFNTHGGVPFAIKLRKVNQTFASLASKKKTFRWEPRLCSSAR